VRRLLVALLAMSAVVFAVTACRTYLDLRRIQAGGRSAASGLAAARTLAPDLLSYDYRTIDQDLRRAQDRATGALARRYRELAATLPEEARRRSLVQQVVVAAAGVESATPEEVRVLVFVNMIRSSSEPGRKDPEQQVSQGRARLVLVTDGDGWRASDLSTLLGDTPAR
jgi:Mce-associated membrane protein